MVHNHCPDYSGREGEQELLISQETCRKYYQRIFVGKDEWNSKLCYAYCFILSMKIKQNRVFLLTKTKKGNNMKKIYLVLIVLVFVTLFSTCSREEIVNNNLTIDTAGVFVLCEGLYPNSGDYSFILKNDSVINDVYSNSNNGALLGLPDGIFRRNDQKLFITVQGTYSGQGKMYRINALTNQLEAFTPDFGQNPYSFAQDANGIFYVSNLFGNTVTRVDGTSMLVLNSINVGSNPSEVISGGAYIYVCKASYTSQNTLAAISSNNTVTFINFPSTPVSATYNNGNLYVSSFIHKKVYVIDANATVKDSISLEPVFTYNACTEIIAGDINTLYITGGDTAFGYATGKGIYKIDIPSKTVTNIITFSGSDDIFGLAYEPQQKFIYTASSNSGSAGKVFKFDSNGGIPLKTYQLGGSGGYFPRRFAFIFN